MKSERRHELQHNELAEWLAKTVESVKPHQNAITAVVAAVVLAAVVYSWWSRTAASQSAMAWDELNVGIAMAVRGGSLDRLSMVVEQYPGTPAGNTAGLVAADFRLMGGCAQRFVNKASAEQELSKAIGLYESVLRTTKTPSLLERATFGLARAKEAKGELRDAESHYQRLVKEWPNSAYVTIAKQRLEDLKRPETKRMFDDFAKFDPKPAFSGESAPTGDLPAFDDKATPADRPATFPATTKDQKPEGSNKAKGAAKESKPAGGKKK